MKTEVLKKELERVEAEFVSLHNRDSKRARTMLEAIVCVIFPTEENERRIMKLMMLVMGCSETKRMKTEWTQFTTSLIAADYYFSIKEGKKAVPFLNHALQLYCEWMEAKEKIEIKDADTYIKEFRTKNLKGQVERKKQAINCIYIYNEAARRLNLDLFLEELLDDVPFSWHKKNLFQILVMCLVSGKLLGISLSESLSPWFAAKESGHPISIFEAWQPMDLPMLYAGILMFLITIIFSIWVGSNNYISIMSKLAYWKFNK